MVKQKEIFLRTEGNAWFNRNRTAIDGRNLPEEDDILVEISKIPPPVTPASLQSA